MVQTLNFISLSSQQAPNDVDWSGLVKAGVQGALIRLGHGIIRDPCASGHIAKAKQYGLYWHGYHTYEGVVNEPQFTIKNATELGLSNSQYYFVDLTNSSDPVNDYYALHATWLSQGYSTGLLISNKDYLSKFTDSEVTASGTLRWLISDNVPSNYDVWQYSSEGTVGTSSVKVGFNFSKTDKLKYNLDTTLTGADFNKDPYNPKTPVGGAYIGWGYDTTGLGGGKTIGYSTNGKNFYALIGPDGLIVRKSDGDRIYGTISDQINSAISANVIPAKSAADSAVSAANAAVESAQVTSDAVTAIASATAEAKQGANEAMIRAESAWDVATGAKEAVTDFDPLVKSAQSDAKQANETAMSAYEQSRSAYDAVKADSSAVVAMQSSMADFREDVASTQSVADGAKADAGKALTQIADTANALSDAKTAFNSGVAEAKQLANTAQATADNAVKSASSVASDLTAVSSQVKSNASGITKVTSDVGLLQTTVADNSGNISKIQETAAQIQQAVSDNAGNITVAKQTADSAVAVASDAQSNATEAIQTASQASIAAQNASGQAASAVLTANGAMATASNAKSDATVAVQTASGASLTATNAQGDAAIAKQTASEAIVQASNAESDFAQLSIRANKIEANVATNSGAIASVQQTANGLTTTVGNVDDRVKTIEDKTDWTTVSDTALDMNDLTKECNIYYRRADLKNSPEQGWAFIQVNVAGDGERITQTVWHDRSSIQYSRTGDGTTNPVTWDAWNKAATYAQVTEVKQTVDGLSTLVSDPKAGMTATYQTASQASLTAQNASGQAVTAVTTAQGAVTTANNAQSDAVVAKQTASEASVTASTAAGDASVAKQTASQASISVQNAQSDITSLDARADSLEAFQKDASGNINKLVSRADGVDQTLTNQAGDISSLQSRAGKLESSMSTANGQISTLQQTANGLTTTVADIKANGGGRNLLVGTSTASGDVAVGNGNYIKGAFNGYDAVKTNGAWSERCINLQSALGRTDAKAGDWYTISVYVKADKQIDTGSLGVYRALGNGDANTNDGFLDSISMQDKPITTQWKQYSWSFQINNISLQRQGTRIEYSQDTGDNWIYWGGWMLEKGTVAHDWSPAPDDLQNQFTQIKQSVDGVATTINDPKTGLNATYQTAAGNSTTISSVKGDVTQLQSTANGLTSRVGNLDSKTATQQTAIDQNKAAIALKADQTTVNTLKGTVDQNTATLKTQADQIQSKVSASDVSGMLTGYATQSYTQSLVTQKADQWNLNLTNLQTDVNAIKTTGGGVNLAHNTSNAYVIPGDPVNVYKNIGSLSNDEWVALAGETITIGVTVEWTNWQGGGNNRFGFEIAPTKNGQTYWGNSFSLWYSPGNGSSGKQRLTVTKTVMNDLDGMNEGFAYVQGNCDTAKISELMIERGSVAHDWSPAPSDMATVTAVTNLAIGVEGVQAQVYNSDGSSKITQLSNLIATKVSQGDYNSQITQLQNAINQRVQVGDVISQINQEAGGDTLIQVSNGKKTLILDAGNTVFTGKAWIPSAAISNIQADQVQIGNSRLFGDDGSLNLINPDAGNASIKLTTGTVLGSTQPVTQFANGYNTNAMDISPVGTVIRPSLFFEDYPGQAKDNGWLGFSRRNTAEVQFNTYDNSKELFRIACAARVNHDLHVDGDLWQGGLSIASGNTIWSGSDFLAIGTHLTNSYGNVIARSFSSQSTLSSKTNIETVDPKYALDLVNRTDIRSYQYTADVAIGKTKRYTSMIIDDVHDVSQYYAPDEFTNEERTGRDDGSAVGYLFLAVKELTRRIKILEDKLNE